MIALDHMRFPLARGLFCLVFFTGKFKPSYNKDTSQSIKSKSDSVRPTAQDPNTPQLGSIRDLIKRLFHDLSQSLSPAFRATRIEGHGRYWSSY
jgi:hypothetical protein